MALTSILDMVKSRLPFVPGDNSLDPKISQFILEQFYYLQTYTGKTDGEVETEINYSGLQKMLVAELVCCELIARKTLENVGGVGGASGSAGKRIKKGKADVVEAEFDYGKATDGTFLGSTSDAIYMSHAKKACEYAATLQYSLPFCGALGLGVDFDTPGFVFLENPGLNCC